ncbi:MAG: hypothetical protein MI892_14145, partial [Desulfobacterales bacterium]|nr:hypothetical protein [Desulfobacterales bacterium]
NGNIDRGMALDLCYRSISTQLRQMLMEYRPPDLDADVLKRLNRFMSEKGVSDTVITQLDTYITRNEETLV